LWAKVMAARFPDTYSERNKVELTGKDGNPMEIDHFNTALENLLNVVEKKLG